MTASTMFMLEDGMGGIAPRERLGNVGTVTLPAHQINQVEDAAVIGCVFCIFALWNLWWDYIILRNWIPVEQLKG